MLGVYLKMAWRNVFRNRRRSIIVLGAVSVAVASVLFVNLFSAGMMEQMLRAAINSHLGHIQIHRKGYADNPVVSLTMDDPAPVIHAVEDLGGAIEGYSPRVAVRGLAQSATNSAGVQIIGVDAARESTLTIIARRIVAGHYLTGRSSPRRKEVIIGTALAEKLGVGLKKKIVLIAQARGGEVASGAFRVVGLFRLPSDQMNKSLVYLNLADMQEMLNIDGGLSEVMVMLKDDDDVLPVRNQIVAALDTTAYEVRTWRDASKQLAQMVDLFDASLIIYVIIIFVGAAFGIVNSMLMAVFERTREFGIMRAIGTRGWALFRTVVYEAIFIGILGIVGGCALMGVLHVLWLKEGLDLSIFAKSLALFGSDAVIKPYFRWDLFIETVVVVLVMTALASVWPALRASRMQPAEAMRHH